MSNESFQETLFEDPLGLRFRHAREKLHWSAESVAQRTKLPLAVIEAIEREDWARLGAPIYVRSYVNSYARLLGLPAGLADDVVRQQPAPVLKVEVGSARGRGALDRGLLNVGYLAMTAAILGVAFMLLARFKQSAEPVSPPTAKIEALAAPAVEPPVSPSSQPEVAASPVMASLAPTLPVAGGSADLVIRFQRDSWVDFVANDGRRIERGMVPAGSERHFKPGEVARITLGDATSVSVDFAGRNVDLAPYREANVARFAVSSTGEPTPLGN
ncbi:helix-turn-helix domain-containing protein [Arenimonas sp.]|uniref:helix-turn-helix domain-containing protein n=1 Tax=Arenimonas sp. TaxID=1872635 RepID=UPI0039E52E0D